MAVQFVLGRSGTGKTTLMVQQIVEELRCGGDENLILLVPEQATYQAERMILGEKRIAGYSRLKVLSFRRLESVVSGHRRLGREISKIARQMVVGRLLREHKEELSLLGASAEEPGTAVEVGRIISEFHRYSKSGEDIEALTGQLGKQQGAQLSRRKFEDIGLIFRKYSEFVQGRYLDPDVEMKRFRLEVKEADLLKGARVWVDGFSGFTLCELEILEQILASASGARVALCLDPELVDIDRGELASVDPADLFYPTELTYSELSERLRKRGVNLSAPVVLSEAVRFAGNPELSHIEKQIFAGRVDKIKAKSLSVRVVSAEDERREAYFAASQIDRLVRQEGLRYRDIAVIASDIEAYEHYLRAYLEDYQVPYFIDRQKSLNQHPLAQLVLSGLRAAAGGLANSDIFAFLKTDLGPVESRYDVDMLENYCVAFGIHGSDWERQEQWRFAGPQDREFDEKRVDTVRRGAVKSILALKKRLAGSDDGQVETKEFVEAVLDFVDELGVGAKIRQWIAESEQRRDIEQARRHGQFYQLFRDVFGELVEVFDGERMSCADYIGLLRFAFSQMNLALIPQMLDQVLVGSIERSRHPELKAVFLLGATEKNFPVPVRFDNLLTDEDRAAAEAVDFELAGGSDRRLAERQYLAYIAFTRASQRLYVTYPTGGKLGGAVVRSQFVDQLMHLFDGMEEEKFAGVDIDVENIRSRAELAEVLCAGLGSDQADTGVKSRFEGLLEKIRGDEQLRDVTELVSRAVNYDNAATLDEKLVGRLFAGPLHSSATKLGTFAKCPYHYFSKYVLRLEPRRKFELKPLDKGVFYHEVLEQVHKKLAKEGQHWGSVGEERLLEVSHEVMAEVVENDPMIHNFVARRLHNKFVVDSACEVLEDCVKDIRQMVRAGNLEPVRGEMAFGKKDDELGELRLKTDSGREVIIRGKIDRFDVVDTGEKKLGLVFDYKSTERAFSWREFLHGLDMQLVIYMLAVRLAGGAKKFADDVGGAFYMPIQADTKSADIGGLERQSGKFARKAKGLLIGDAVKLLDTDVKNWSRFYNFALSKDSGVYAYKSNSAALTPSEFANTLSYCRRKISELAEQIISGQIDINPFRLSGETACRYCEFRSVCRFDWQINDYNYLQGGNKNDILARIEEENG